MYNFLLITIFQSTTRINQECEYAIKKKHICNYMFRVRTSDTFCVDIIAFVFVKNPKHKTSCFPIPEIFRKKIFIAAYILNDIYLFYDFFFD